MRFRTFALAFTGMLTIFMVFLVLIGDLSPLFEKVQTAIIITLVGYELERGISES